MIWKDFYYENSTDVCDSRSENAAIFHNSKRAPDVAYSLHMGGDSQLIGFFPSVEAAKTAAEMWLEEYQR